MGAKNLSPIAQNLSPIAQNLSPIAKIECGGVLSHAGRVDQHQTVHHSHQPAVQISALHFALQCIKYIHVITVQCILDCFAFQLIHIVAN